MIDVRLQESEFLEGYSLASRWTMSRWLAIGGQSLLFLAIGLFLLLSDAVSADLHPLGGAAIGGVLGAWISGSFHRFVLIPKKLRKRFKQREGLHQVSTISWGDKGLTLENANGHMLTPWSTFIKWRQGEKLVLLYASQVNYVVLPKRTFANAHQLDDFLSLLGNKIGAQQSVPGRPA